MNGKLYQIIFSIIISFSLVACEQVIPSSESTQLIEIKPTNQVTDKSDSNLETGKFIEGLVRIDYRNIVGSPPALYGSNGWWTDQDEDIWRDRYHELGVRVIRLPLAQAGFEPHNDDDDPNHINPKGFLFNTPIPWFDRTITLRKWLEMLKSQQITVMITIPYLAGWLSANRDQGLNSTYPPNNLEEYREYLRALLQFAVNEIGIPPDKIILEPVNEPDLECGQDRAVTCFWQEWKMEDLVNVMRVAYDEAKKISPSIRLAGVSECCGTGLLDVLISQYDGLSYLDILSYHKYVNNFDFTDCISRGEHLKTYGKPVILNEYGNTKYWSNGISGALWHAAILPQIWKIGIQPLQFPISDFPGSHQGYNKLGLFYDWRANWTLKPAYWVYSNFYSHFGGNNIVSVDNTQPVSILVSRDKDVGEHNLAIWLTNLDTRKQIKLHFVIDGFPDKAVEIHVINNLEGPTAIETIQITSPVLEFDFKIPSQSSFCILITTFIQTNSP